MTELETMQRAKTYIDKLANGIDPLTDEVINDDSVINNVRISRCLFYVSGVIQGVIDNGGVISNSRGANVIPFSLSAEERAKIEVTEEPVGITKVTKRINDVIRRGMKRMQPKYVSDWLVANGYLEEIIVSGKTNKIATPKGESIGIDTIDIVTVEGRPYKKNIYDANAQRFIILNLDEIAESLTSK